MSEPGVDPSSGKSSGDGMRPPERHPAYRRREPRPGSRAERENLAGDGKGKGTSGSNREAESTDARARGGLLRSSKEAGVMARGAKEAGHRRWERANWQQEELQLCGGTSRMTRECQVRRPI